jgi:hypothetical protein
MARAEQNRLAYLFRLRMTANVRRSLDRAMSQSHWADAGQGWQGKETSLRLAGWSRQRRIILLRRKLTRELAMTDRTDPEQPLLGFAEVGPDKQLWQYAALVTSLDSEIFTHGQLYCNRADCENVFDELKNQWEEPPVPEAQANQPRKSVTIRTDNSNREAHTDVTFKSNGSK